MCRQYVLSRARSGTTSGTTVTSVTSIFGTGNTIGVHEDCANAVCIYRWCADDMCVCRWCADDTRCSTAWNWATQGSVRMTCRWHADDMCVQMTCRWHADNVQMTYGWSADDMCVCGWHADDTRCSTSWNWATQASVQMTCGWHPDDICHLPVKSHPKSHSRVIRTSSACHLHVIRTSSTRRLHETSTSNIFPLKEQTALLKTKYREKIVARPELPFKIVHRSQKMSFITLPTKNPMWIIKAWKLLSVMRSCVASGFD